MNSSIYLTLLFFWMTRGKVYMMFVIALGFRYFKHIYLDKCTLFEVKKFITFLHRLCKLYLHEDTHWFSDCGVGGLRYIKLHLQLLQWIRSRLLE